jgi:hypothetical protein
MCVFVNIVLPKKSQFAIPNPEPTIEKKEDNIMLSEYVVTIKEPNRKNVIDKLGSKIVILARFEGIFLREQIKEYEYLAYDMLVKFILNNNYYDCTIYSKNVNNSKFCQKSGYHIG